MTALLDLSAWPVPRAAAAVVARPGQDAGVGSDAPSTGQPRVLEAAGDVDATYPLASVTKLLTAYAVLVAVEEGAVELDQPAGPPGATLRHLLAHTAGYGFESSAPVLARPGTRRIYSNRGMEEAAALVQRASGVPFATYLDEAVLAPLGMTSTRLAGSPAAEAVSTVTDLTRFAAELLAPRLLHPETATAYATVQFPGLAGVLPGHGRCDPLDWGLGPERAFRTPGHWAGTRISPSAFGHFGASGTFLWVDPAAGVATVCLTDTDFGPWAREAWPALSDRVLAGTARSAGSAVGGGG